ncbi:hypothetical protein ONZ45_g15122 [Pleurotus djamor]|nr:hypothetical protein ONZ45_g15122 [Pleurotus djamor]
MSGYGDNFPPAPQRPEIPTLRKMLFEFHHHCLRTFLLSIILPLVLAQFPSNLPPAGVGVFTAQGSSVINAPIDVVWNVVLNFTAYPEWNPFARSMVMVDDSLFKNPLEDQTPVVGRRVLITASIPPLQPPVNASTPSNPLQTQESLEVITTIDPVTRRASWKQIMIPSLLMIAERTTALSVVETPDGPRVFYESREVFQQLLSLVGFEAQAIAVKERAEALAAV